MPKIIKMSLTKCQWQLYKTYSYLKKNSNRSDTGKGILKRNLASYFPKIRN